MNALLSVFSFQGKMRRLPYAAWSLGIFAGQYLLIAAVFARYVQAMTSDWRIYVLPLRPLVLINGFPPAAFPLAFAVSLLVTWSLALLAFRRAADADVSRWIAAVAIVPVLQVPAILFLCVMPSRDAKPPPQEEGQAKQIDWPSAVQGALAGAALTVFAVAVGALVFGTYGFGMFVISPLVIGATTGFLANRKADIGRKRTSEAIFYGLLLGAVGLVLGALEGVICIILASPLALGAALIGGALGRAAALSGQRSARSSLMSVAFLPLVFASEYVLPASTSFSTSESIDIDAAPHEVWRAIVRMDPIAEPPALPFRLGVAYPLHGEIVGEGVGAIRKGTFSTGVALERVTEWRFDRKLAFVVFSDPPAMHEMSPYAHVNAPHVKGYFRTTYTSFEIVPLANGGSRVLETTRHELRLDPILYWMQFARWIIHENNMRVLTHMRDQAEHSRRVADAARPRF